MCQPKGVSVRLFRVGDTVRVNSHANFSPCHRKVTAVKTEEPISEGAIPFQFVTVVRLDGKGIPMTFARCYLELVEDNND